MMILVSCKHGPRHGIGPLLTLAGKFVVFTTDPSNRYTKWKCSLSSRKDGAVLVSLFHFSSIPQGDR
jgi:hypothetical protein